MDVINQAKISALLSADCSEASLEKVSAATNRPVVRAKMMLGREVVIISAWPLESQFPNSALVLVENHRSEQYFCIVRGNAGRQVLYLHSEKLTPSFRRLVSVEDDHMPRLVNYFWEEIRLC